MSDTNVSFSPQYILTIVLKRRWLVLAPFLAVMAVGIGLALTLPKLYRSSTLILVEAQRVPTTLVQTVVSSDINERIATLSQQIMSRTNLERILEQFQLFSSPKYAKMYLEDKIELLRKQITIEVTRGQRQGRQTETDAFTVSFVGEKPVTVMRVTNALAQFFIDENLKVREDQATGTSEFLQSELHQMRLKLEEQEANLKNYRERYMGGLPEQLQSNLMVLERLQTQLANQMQNLREARNRLALLDSQIASVAQAQEQTAALTPAAEPPAGQREAEGALTLPGLKARLAALRSRYTDKHPDVVRLARIVAEMEAQPSPAPAAAPDAPAPPAAARPSRMVAGLQDPRVVQQEIASIEASIASINGQIAQYQRQVEETPKREQELLTIERDYENIKTTYTSLLNRKLEADISVNMEKKQKGERFRVVDPAKVMERPFSPDMRKLFLITLAAAIGCGAGLVFLAENLDTSLRRPEEAAAYLKVPVAAVLPTILHPADIRRDRLMNVLSVAAAAAGLLLTAGLAAVSFLGVEGLARLAGKLQGL
jgi:polysaccharide chain length determinant protein (PEP-CTERM system associated)